MTSRSVHRRRGAPLWIGTVALALCLGLVPAAWALFTDTATVTAGSTAATAFTSGQVVPPVTVSPSQASPTAGPTVTWAAGSVVGGGTTPPAVTGYTLLQHTAQTGGTTTTACTATPPTQSCTPNPAPPATGTTWFSVRAALGGWTAESARVAYRDVLPPTVAVTAPTAGGRTSGALVTSVNSACNTGTPTGTPAAILCGTAADTAGVTSVQYRLERTPLLSPTQCWTGSTWGTCTAGTYLTATGGQTWRVAGNPQSAYGTLAASYVLRVLATDGNGNQTPVASAFTVQFSTLL